MKENPGNSFSGADTTMWIQTHIFKDASSVKGRDAVLRGWPEGSAVPADTIAMPCINQAARNTAHNQGRGGQGIRDPCMLGRGGSFQLLHWLRPLGLKSTSCHGSEHLGEPSRLLSTYFACLVY